MRSNEIVKLCCGSRNINWSHQQKLLTLLLKQFSEEEIIFAINFWRSQGVDIKSLGFLTYNNFVKMSLPIQALEAKKYTKKKEGEDSFERNKRKIEQANKTNNRKKSYWSAFEE